MIDFEQQIVAGTTLIREAIQSQNFAAGVSGWIIEASGNAEFNSITVRGRFVVGSETSQYIAMEISPIFPFRPTITLSTGAGPGVEQFPATIITSDPASTQLTLILNAPAAVGALDQPQIYLSSEAGIPGVISLVAGEITFQGGVVTTAVPILLEQAWSAIPLAGTWGDLAGARANYFKDSSGRVQLRGIVVGGAGPGIGTLPAGYRPAQNMEWIMRGQGGVIMCAVTVNTAGVLTATANAATAQAAGVRLDSISFPTLA